jgi:hypothetical protein
VMQSIHLAPLTATKILLVDDDITKEKLAKLI